MAIYSASRISHHVRRVLEQIERAFGDDVTASILVGAHIPPWRKNLLRTWIKVENQRTAVVLERTRRNWDESLSNKIFFRTTDLALDPDENRL